MSLTLCTLWLCKCDVLQNGLATTAVGRTLGGLPIVICL